MIFLRFVFGLLIGSFLDVIARRYDPDEFILSREVIGGRSRCEACGKQLRWFELVPVFSFVAQGGRCRFCKARLSWEYPVVELLSGFIFVFVPWRAEALKIPFAAQIVWSAVFVCLLLVALIDLRLQIIPDEINLALALFGAALSFLVPFGPTQGSFLGPYGLLFGARDGILLNRLLAFGAAAVFFGFLILITRGKGMGGGDLKLAAALGLVFGWPDIIFVISFAFVIGSCYGIFKIITRGFSRKSLIPFGPFLVLGAAAVFLCGIELLNLYFHLVQAV